MRRVNLNETRLERTKTMRKIVWTFGLIGGVIMAGLMLITLPFHDAIGFDWGYVVGYAGMVAAFLMVYVGIKSYRDSVGGGAVGFGRAVAVGMLIVTVASACYVVTWEAVYYSGHGQDIMAKYTAHTIEQERAKGTSQAELDKKIAEMQKFEELYKNPLVNSAMTFLEPLPVGVLIALVSAGILRRRRESGSATGGPKTA